MPDQQIIDQIIKAVREVIEPDKIILFGSQARGDSRQDSDYDILVIKDGIENERKVAQDIYVKLVSVKASVDVIVKTPDMINKSIKRFVSVTKEALNEGIVIYG